MERKSILLFHAPYSDFTYPYHSLAYLVAPLRRAGYEVEAIDLNIEWFRSVFVKDRLESWRAELLESFRQLERRPSWSIEDQAEAVQALRSLGAIDTLDPDEVIETMRSERFYHYPSYLRAQMGIRNFERIIDHIYGYPFYTAFAVPPVEPNAAQLVTNALGCERFIADVQALLTKRLGGRRFLMCGMSAPFNANVRLGFAALEAVRRVFPSAARVAGGTAVTDIFKYRTSDETLGKLAPLCDYLLPGEGDEAIVEMARWLEQPDAWRPPRLLVDLRGASPSVGGANEKLKYVSLAAERPMPDYSWIDWSLYLSPARQVNYSPTRGCFWNRCTFCDYGLNDDLPTAPYRAAPAADAARHMKELRRQGVDHVYFSVDAIAPVQLRQLARALVDDDVGISWSSEFFLTPQFDQTLLPLLQRAGLVTASFGLESGSSRVLELMGKGRGRVEEVYRPVFEALRGTTIGLQPKFFFGFPGETGSERWDTVDLLNEHRQVFAVVTGGNVFDLTSGSMVAKNPETFGIRGVRRCEGFDICGGCDYELASGEPLPGPNAFDDLNAALNYFHAFERPFAGGIDTFHTTLYVKRFGRDVFHRLGEQWRSRDAQTRPWARVDIDSGFAIDEAFDNVLVKAAMEFSCMRERATHELGPDELAKELAQVEQPLPRSEEPFTYHIRFC